MVSKKKRDGEEDSDLVAWYGAESLALPYEKRFELLLNLNRIRQQWTYVFASGLATAQSLKPIDPSFFQAVSESIEEAEELADKTNSERQLAKVMSEIKF